MELATATINDIPQLCKLLKILFSQEAEFKADENKQIYGLSEIINNPGLGDILIIRENNEIKGMVNLLYTISTALGSKVAILEDMVILPNSRSKGIGSKLINHAIHHAKNKNCKRITLLTDADNFNAQDFYQKYGFNRSTMVPFRLNLE